MKKLILGVVAATAVAVFQVSAITVTVDQVTGYNAGDGEFNVSPVTGVGYAAVDLYNNNSGALGFGTFCIDRGVGIATPGQYDATVIESGINPNSGNQISLGTAWLYQQFATGGTFGGLATYDYTVGVNRVNSAYAMQLAIWVLEGQYDITSIVSNTFLDAVTTKFGSIANAEVDNNQVYDVGVLGLNTLDANGRPTTTAAQPMLTLLPDGGSALLLLGMGLTGLALVSRKVLA